MDLGKAPCKANFQELFLSQALIWEGSLGVRALRVRYEFPNALACTSLVRTAPGSSDILVVNRAAIQTQKKFFFSIYHCPRLFEMI
jgi:hypothetical protein